jgi:hypothetical protein
VLRIEVIDFEMRIADWKSSAQKARILEFGSLIAACDEPFDPELTAEGIPSTCSGPEPVENSLAEVGILRRGLGGVGCIEWRKGLDNYGLMPDPRISIKFNFVGAVCSRD